MSIQSDAAALMTPTEALMRGFVHSPVPGVASDLPLQRASATRQQESRQGIRVGALRLMLRYEDGSELTELPPVYRLPNAPSWLAGMANLHGMLVPVFDLADWLGMPASAAAAKPMLLVLSHGENAAGVLIDGLPQRLRWSADDATAIDSAPPALAVLLRGAALIGDQLWFDLDCAALLGALENGLGASP